MMETGFNFSGRAKTVQKPAYRPAAKNKDGQIARLYF